MAGKMDWRRAAQRDAQRQPLERHDHRTPSAPPAWRTILDVMAETPRSTKAKGRKPFTVKYPKAPATLR